MKLLFMHRNFPAQFRHLLKHYTSDPNNEVVFLTAREEGQIEGVKKAVYKLNRDPNPNIHQYLRFYEESILHGQAAAGVALKLRQQGFIPDVIYGHTWGPTLFMKEVFPESPLLCYFEWFYNAENSDVDFPKGKQLTVDTKSRLRIKNSHLLVDLYTCDKGISPTFWQMKQFPKEFQKKISVIHDGVDVDYYTADPDDKLVIPELNLDLSDKKEIITYVGRGMEEYRGFPEFMKSIEIIQKRRPEAHVVIVGQDRVCYGRKLPEGQSFKQKMLEEVDLDMSRVHFTGLLGPEYYRKVLRNSSAHIYLTYPFVLSWSLMESLAAECLVIASDTQPVKEVIQDGHNGLLADFYSPERIADRVDEVFANPEKMNLIRKRAREKIVKNYALTDLLPRHISIINDLAKKKNGKK